MYLLTTEYVDVKNCDVSIDTKLFASKENAEAELKEYKESIISDIKRKNNSGTIFDGLVLETEEHSDERDFLSFTAEKNNIAYFQKHIIVSITPINCEDAEPMFTLEDFCKDQINHLLEARLNVVSSDYDDLASDLAIEAVDNEYLWQTFDDGLMSIMDNNPDYQNLEKKVSE